MGGRWRSAALPSLSCPVLSCPTHPRPCSLVGPAGPSGSWWAKPQLKAMIPPGYRQRFLAACLLQEEDGAGELWEVSGDHPHLQTPQNTPKCLICAWLFWGG